MRTLQSCFLMVTPYRAVGLCHCMDNFDCPPPAGEVMSPLTPKADMRGAASDVRYGPIADNCNSRVLSNSGFDMDQCSNRKYWSKKVLNYAEGYTAMRFRPMSLACVVSLFPMAANAQLTIDMNNITCSQYLAMQPSQSRSFSAWMSGWFSYQLNKETIDLLTHEKNIANVKAWCQYHPQETVMSGLKNATGQ
jgi:hypothetical protein